MSIKRENIIEAALECFLQDGFHGTSTKKVAKLAGVSEGLIFKHFENKEGLLNAVMNRADEIMQVFYDNIIYETEPKKAIRKAIELPFKIEQSDIEKQYCKVYQKLRWELNIFDPRKLFPLQTTLTINFTKLGFSSPVMEAEFLVHYVDFFCSALWNNQVKDKTKMLQFLKHRYEI